MFLFEKKCFVFQTQKPTLTWSSVLLLPLDSPDLLAAIVATCTVHTAVINYHEMAPKPRETVCTNGFVFQRKNGKSSSDSHVVTTKNTARPGPDGVDPGFPGRAEKSWPGPL